jgi:PAS domain S-box-containing protein
VEAAEGVTPGALDLPRLLGETADGMVAVAPGGTIVGWNEGAAALLGYREEEVVGRPCYEVFAWLDRCGNPVCSASCPSCRLPGDGELAQSREVVARSKAGLALWLSVSTLVPPTQLQSQCRLVHFLREVALPPELERLVAERLRPPAGPAADDGADTGQFAALGRLTAREREVLQLLADGAGTREIAARLTVSPTTVRNHVQNALGKLGAHSRLEAVILFVRHSS